jgi:hypothetical protein
MLVVFLMLPAPVLGGTANDPEIISRPNTSAILRGDVIPHLEITKGWIQPQRDDDRFRFVLEVASLPPLEDIPKDSVYVFHYTIPEIGRLYWRANWSADQSRMEFLGGMYAGCVPTVCGPGNTYDNQGNRNYMYMPGSAEQRERVQGEIIPGAPGRIAWSYPMSGYGPEERLNGLEMKGLFGATYTFTESGALRYADIAMSVRDYTYSVSTPWHERLLAQIPGPSPVIIVGALVGLLAAAGRTRGKNDEDQEPPGRQSL